MQEFRGKTAVITGGASGIGLAMGKLFARKRLTRESHPQSVIARHNIVETVTYSNPMPEHW